MVVTPGAPGEASRSAPASTATRPAIPNATPADIAFMQGMIGHHRQAIEMVELLRTRTQRDDMKLLGKRIEVSQNDEIRMMSRWLEDRGAEVPGEHAMHMPGAHLMPGMLTAGQMTALAAAAGPAFDRLFLEGMIQHHEGALSMVDALFKRPGAGQEAQIFDFASHVDADQRMEIHRMRGMLTGKLP
ncbi:MAG TPA: DUF305 domain-containing protein [Vicinamibacterales bacterium]|nr:DUF305 domain-containing protein [Vicinamibacterales bacterium]